jgi:hypothetical protein
MLSPFFLLVEWSEAMNGPQMPGMAALAALERIEDWPLDTDGEPHRIECACPDCDPQETPMLED